MNKRNKTELPKYLRKGNEKLTFGKQIAQKRNFLRMTQEELAEKLNVSKSAIAKWETDRGYPDRDNLFNLAAILDLELLNTYSNTIDNQADIKQIEALEAYKIINEIIKIFELYGYEVKKQDEVTQGNQG